MESGGVNSGITAAVSNVKSIYCGVSGCVQQAKCDYSPQCPNPCQEEDKVDAERVLSDDKGDKDATNVH